MFLAPDAVTAITRLTIVRTSTHPPGGAFSCERGAQPMMRLPRWGCGLAADAFGPLETGCRPHLRDPANLAPLSCGGAISVAGHAAAVAHSGRVYWW